MRSAAIRGGHARVKVAYVGFYRGFHVLRSSYSRASPVLFCSHSSHQLRFLDCGKYPKVPSPNSSMGDKFKLKQRITLQVRYKFWDISLPSSAKQQRAMSKFLDLWRTRAQDGEFFFFLVTLSRS